MIPSAKIAIRPRPPPENRFSSPRMLLPPKFFSIEPTALELIPGAGMCVPSRYSPSSSAVNSTFLRISPTLNAPRIVEIMASALRDALRRRRGRRDELAGAASGLDLLARTLRKRMRVHGQRLRDRALGQDLDRDGLVRGQALGLERLESHRVTGLEAGFQVEQVDGLGVGAEGLE